MTPRDTVLAIVVAALWGFAFVPIRIGVGEMPPLVLTALRFFFSAVPFVFFIRPPKAPAWLVVAFGLTLGVVKFGLLFTGMKLGMPVGLSSLVMQMQVFFTILLAALIGREMPTRLQIIATLIALAGLGVIGLSDQRGAPLLPFLMLVLAAFVWSIANMLSRLAKGADMLAFIVWASLAAPLPLFALAIAFDGWDAAVRPLLHPTLSAILCVAFLSLGATIFCFSVWTRLLGRYPAAVVTPFALLVPVFGFLSGWLLMNEQLPLPVMIGTGLVLAGLALNVLGPQMINRVR